MHLWARSNAFLLVFWRSPWPSSAYWPPWSCTDNTEQLRSCWRRHHGHSERGDPCFGLWVFIGSFDELAGLEAGTGPNERDEVGRVRGALAGLRGLDEFEHHRQARGLRAETPRDLS